MGDLDVRLERTVRADADRVWATLTRPDLVQQWMMGAKVTSTWAKGASIEWKGDYDGKPYTDEGEVLEVEPGSRLVHTHRSGATGDGEGHRVQWELSPDGEGTSLRLTQSGAHTRDEAMQFESGWAHMLDAFCQVAEGRAAA